jgi:hypothetical protein
MTGYGTFEGLDLDNLDVTTDDEIDAQLAAQRKRRGPLDPGPMYATTAFSVWLYTRPDLAKLHMRTIKGWGSKGLKPIITAGSFTNMHTYINQGWMTGIENCTRGLQIQGVRKAQLIEAIMHAQLSAGIRGLQHVYLAIGILLGDYVERPEPPDWPEGWASDPGAFKCGMDYSTRELTALDRKAIFEWYEKNVGEVPKRIEFVAKHDPETLKNWRAQYESTFKGALPKQMWPYLSLRHCTVVGDRGGIREAALLGKNWGMTDAYIFHTVMEAAYFFTGWERLDMAAEFLEQVLD